MNLQSSVGNVCKQAQSGAVDVAFVYSSDVYRFGGVKVIGVVPDDTHKNIIYPAAICKDSTQAEAANEFIEWLPPTPMPRSFGRSGASSWFPRLGAHTV